MWVAWTLTHSRLLKQFAAELIEIFYQTFYMKVHSLRIAGSSRKHAGLVVNGINQWLHEQRDSNWGALDDCVNTVIPTRGRRNSGSYQQPVVPHSGYRTATSVSSEYMYTQTEYLIGAEWRALQYASPVQMKSTGSSTEAIDFLFRSIN